MSSLVGEIESSTYRRSVLSSFLFCLTNFKSTGRYLFKAYCHNISDIFLFESKLYKCSQRSKELLYISSLILYKYYEVLLLSLTACNNKLSFEITNDLLTESAL